MTFPVYAGTTFKDFVEQIRSVINVGAAYDSTAEDYNSLDTLIRKKVYQAVNFLERNFQWRYMNHGEVLTPQGNGTLYSATPWKKIDTIQLFDATTQTFIHKLDYKQRSELPESWLNRAVTGTPVAVTFGSVVAPNAASRTAALSGNIDPTNPVSTANPQYWGPKLFRQVWQLWPAPATVSDFYVQAYGWRYMPLDPSVDQTEAQANRDNTLHWLLDFANEVVEAKTILLLEGSIKMNLRRDYQQEYQEGLAALVREEEGFFEGDSISMEYDGENDSYGGVKSHYPDSKLGGFDTQ